MRQSAVKSCVYPGRYCGVPGDCRGVGVPALSLSRALLGGPESLMRCIMLPAEHVFVLVGTVVSRFLFTTVALANGDPSAEVAKTGGGVLGRT